VGKLTGDEFDTIAGKRDKLVGKIQERYGCSRDEADAQVKSSRTSTTRAIEPDCVKSPASAGLFISACS
jgi:hypothetical protein